MKGVKNPYGLAVKVRYRLYNLLLSVLLPKRQYSIWRRSRSAQWKLCYEFLLVLGRIGKPRKQCIR